MHEHITVEGDTFDALALRYYGKDRLAWKIIQANPDYCDTLIFEAGIVLIIPDNSDVVLPQTLPPWRQ